MTAHPDQVRRNIFKLTAAGLLGVGVIGRAENVAAQQNSSRSIVGRLAAIGRGRSRRLIPAATYGGVNQPVQPSQRPATRWSGN